MPSVMTIQSGVLLCSGRARDLLHVVSLGLLMCRWHPITFCRQQVNARGIVPVVRLHDVPNHAREITLHGVRQGATVALAMAQVCSRYEL